MTLGVALDDFINVDGVATVVVNDCVGGQGALDKSPEGGGEREKLHFGRN